MSSPPSKILLLAAFHMESLALASALHLPKHPSLPHAYATSQILLLTIGLRASRLPPLRPAIADFAPSQILLFGLGGALNPALHVADVILDSPSLNLPHTISGQIISSDEMLTTPAAKNAHYLRTHADAVDMESAPVRAAFAPQTITILRAISDDAAHSIDHEILSLIDDLGRPRPAKIAFLLARRPTLIPQLARLQKDSAAALAALCKSLAAYLTPQNP